MVKLLPLIVGAFIAAIIAILYDVRPFLNKVGGRIEVDSGIASRWANNTNLNNHDCIRHVEADACEDVKIHFESGSAFLACGDPVQRVNIHWPRPKAKYRNEQVIQDSIWKYDLASRKATRLKLIGLESDFISHGLDVYSLPDDTSKVFLYAISHGFSGDSIIVFSHVLGSDIAEVFQTIKHHSIKNVNALVVISPMCFYLTNDHYYTTGLPRAFEDKYGPWSWAADVQYCDANGPDTICKKVAGTFPGANGIAIFQDTLLVSDNRVPYTYTFKIGDDHQLVPDRVINLGAIADNIHVSPSTGDAIIAVFPSGLDVPDIIHNAHSLGNDFLVPAAAVRINLLKESEPILIFKDNGSTLSFMTAFAVDPDRGVAIGASVLQKGGFMVCDFPKRWILSK